MTNSELVMANKTAASQGFAVGQGMERFGPPSARWHNLTQQAGKLPAVPFSIWNALHTEFPERETKGCLHD